MYVKYARYLRNTKWDGPAGRSSELGSGLPEIEADSGFEIFNF